jgi:hypothetical protein
MLLINHIRPTHICNIIHIRVTAKSLVWPLIHYVRPSCQNFGFPGYSHYIVITASNGFRALEQSSTVLVHIWSLHVDDLVSVVFVNTLVGWLITWTRLQALVTVRSFLLSGQLDQNQSM